MTPRPPSRATMAELRRRRHTCARCGAVRPGLLRVTWARQNPTETRWLQIRRLTVTARTARVYGRDARGRFAVEEVEVRGLHRVRSCQEHIRPALMAGVVYWRDEVTPWARSLT